MFALDQTGNLKSDAESGHKMSLPSHLLNATATIYQETNGQGQFGEVTQALVKSGSTRCRVDQKSSSRYVESGNFEQTQGRYIVYLPKEYIQPVETKFWLKITADYGVTFTGQVDSVRYPGLSGHHTELSLVRRTPSLAVPS
jgi:hypothetical protein